jgi:hypothetical protein
MFTTCCQVAILDDQNTCPKCGTGVEPKGARARWNKAYGDQKRATEALRSARAE